MEEGHGRTAMIPGTVPTTTYLRGGTGWDEGKVWQCRLLSESDARVFCLANSRLSLGKGDFTISLWFKGQSGVDGDGS